MKKLTVIFFATLCFSLSSFAKLNVVASTADIAAMVRVVGGDQINVVAIARGSQDPHYIEAKPSFMVKLNNADLLVFNGLSLEIGWLPSLIRGARNPKVSPGTQGSLDLGSLIEPIDKPTGVVSRAMGDVHPDGNPHFMLDPVIVGDLAVKLANRLGELDGANKDQYATRAKAYKDLLDKKVADWQARIQKSGVKKLVTYHPSLNYFLKRFGLVAPIHLEAKAGVPPSAQHILGVIDLMKNEKIKLILVDNFFDTKIADRVAKDVPGAKVVSVGISVDSAPKLDKLEDVTEELVKAIEGK
jgi:zinc/manganese transport system substrate-binding protein